MILKNPTDSVVSITIKGIELSIPAKGVLEVSEAQGQRWMSIHEFLRTEDEVVTVEVAAAKPASVVKIVEPVKTVVPPVVPEVVKTK